MINIAPTLQTVPPWDVIQAARNSWVSQNFCLTISSALVKCFWRGLMFILALNRLKCETSFEKWLTVLRHAGAGCFISSLY